MCKVACRASAMRGKDAIVTWPHPAGCLHVAFPNLPPDHAGRWRSTAFLGAGAMRELWPCATLRLPVQASNTPHTARIRLCAGLHNGNARLRKSGTNDNATSSRMVRINRAFVLRRRPAVQAVVHS